MTFDAGTWWLAVLLLGFVTAGLVYLLKRSLFGRIDKLDESMKEISENSVKKSDYESKTTTSQQAEINAWVKIAVTAAEQIYTGSGRGAEKKAYVLNWLREHGITVDAEKLDALIEAAVYDLTNNGLIAIEQGVVVGEDDGHEAG